MHSARRHASIHAGSGSTTRSKRAHRGASAVLDSRPAAMRARNAAPNAPPSGTPATCTGRPVVSASASTHPATRVPPPTATIRRAGVGEASMMRRVTKPDASKAARRIAAPPWVRFRSTTCARRAGSLIGTRSPRGYGTHRGTSCGDGAAPDAPARRSTHSRNSPPALLGPPSSHRAPGAVCGTQ